MSFFGKQSDSTHSPAPELKEGEDYEMDQNGNLVFTEAYHLKRGYCCQNGCKHCPFKN